MNRDVYNFCAGPAKLPAEVLARAQAELLDYQGLGVSVMEISHRSVEFDRIAAESEERVRRLLSVPHDYAVLFLAGGATYQFSQLPMNLATPSRPGYYLVHGHWGRKALSEAHSMGLGRLAASSESFGFDRLPEFDPDIVRDGAYLHVVSNETITGVQLNSWPQGEIPLAADMSSDIFSRPLDVSAFGVIYAGAQKNIGPAGMSLLIVRRDLVERTPAGVPGIFSWATQAAEGSRFNTPPTFAWYMANLVFEWLEAQGGVTAMERINRRKAALLYECIDASSLYSNGIHPANRSMMNVPFRLARENLEQRFLAGALEAGLLGLKGHKSVGGMRASLYNAIPEQGVAALVAYMQEFERSQA
jgi:phosphoserine aminotransferase